MTLRNESKYILAYLIHFCSSSRYVMWQAFCSLSHPHVLVSVFGIASWFFQQFFSSISNTGRLFTSLSFLHFAPGFLLWFLQQFLRLCHVSRSSILSLCISYLTTKNFMLTFCTYEIWDTIFIKFISIFILFYFSNFLLCSIKILQANSWSIFANPPEKALLHW